MEVIGFAGWSGSGKTTLVEQVIRILTGRGIAVSLVKHAHHSFDVDHRGKDSWRHRQAGCREVIVGSRNRWTLMHELRDEPEPSLDTLLAHLSPCDIALVEGFKRAPIPKIEVFREGFRDGACEALLFPRDPYVIAVATDSTTLDTGSLPLLDINAPDTVADFVVARCLGEAARVADRIAGL